MIHQPRLPLVNLRWSGLFGQPEGRNKVYRDCDVMPSGRSNPLLVTASRYAETLVSLLWIAGGCSCGACGREARECGRGGGQRGCVVHGIVHTARRARAGPKDSSTNPQVPPCPSPGSWAAPRSAHRATASFVLVTNVSGGRGRSGVLSPNRAHGAGRVTHTKQSPKNPARFTRVIPGRPESDRSLERGPRPESPAARPN